MLRVTTVDMDGNTTTTSTTTTTIRDIVAAGDYHRFDTADHDYEFDLPSVEEMGERLGYAGSLRKTVPKEGQADGLTRFVCRRALLHCGRDTSMPVTASWWLQEWADEYYPEAKVSGIMNEEGKALTHSADDLAVAVCLYHGLNPTKGASRWDGVAF